MLAVLCSWTCAGPTTEPSVAIAVTIPFASDVDTTPLRDTDCGFNDCQITGTFGTGLPAPSSTCAASGAGSLAPGGPDWLLPPVMRKEVGSAPPLPPGGAAKTLKLNTTWMTAPPATPNGVLNPAPVVRN